MKKTQLALLTLAAILIAAALLSPMRILDAAIDAQEEIEWQWRQIFHVGKRDWQFPHIVTVHDNGTNAPTITTNIVGPPRWIYRP